MYILKNIVFPIVAIGAFVLLASSFLFYVAVGIMLPIFAYERLTGKKVDL